MFSKKARNIALLAVIAALLVAIGYWNVSPESFLDKPVAQVDESAIDYYAVNAHSVQFLPGVVSRVISLAFRCSTLSAKSPC